MGVSKDEGLIGNEKIEQYMDRIRQEPSDEVLAALLTSIRRRMKENGQFVVGVEPAFNNGLQVKMLQSTDGRKWIPVYTSFEEEMKGGNQVMSTFLADIGQLLNMALKDATVHGILINPFSQRFVLNQELIRVVVGTPHLS